jgi:hypothetical protein
VGSNPAAPTNFFGIIIRRHLPQICGGGVSWVRAATEELRIELKVQPALSRMHALNRTGFAGGRIA